MWFSQALNVTPFRWAGTAALLNIGHGNPECAGDAVAGQVGENGVGHWLLNQEPPKPPIASRRGSLLDENQQVHLPGKQDTYYQHYITNGE